MYTLNNVIESLHLCFIQEHWLLSAHLLKNNDISSDFLSLSVSGMDGSEFIVEDPLVVALLILS